jgi:Kelch motif
VSGRELLEREVTDALLESAASRPPDRLLANVLTNASGTRPSPLWLALLRERPMRLPTGVAVGSPMVRLATILLATLALAVGAAGALSVGASLLTSPAPARAYLGTFTTAGTMVEGRGNHSATLLGDGRVLLVGGNENHEAELYDPVSGAFDATGATVHHRSVHRAVLLGDGRVLILGGLAEGLDAGSPAELFDPSGGMFRVTGSMSIPREGFSATLLTDGRVLVAGGYADYPLIAATAEIYDPATGTFAATGAMTSPRAEHTATLLTDGRVLIVGGYVHVDEEDERWEVTDRAELYDPATGTFSEAAPMRTAAAARASVRLTDGRVLLAGGVVPRGPDFSVNAAELYVPSTGTFSEVAPMVQPRSGSFLVRLVDGDVLVVGGDSDGGQGAELFDPASLQFSPTGRTTVSRVAAVATLLADGRVLVSGGACRGTGACESAELYE